MNKHSNKTETQAPRASLASRIKNKIKTAAQVVVRTVKTVATTVARVTRTTASKAWGKVASAWRTAIRPVLKTWSKWTAAALWATSLVIAPAATIAATILAGALAFGIAYVWERLEKQDTRSARFGIRMIKMFMRAIRATFYVASSLLVLLLASASLPFAMLFVADLVFMAITKGSMLDTSTRRASRTENLDIPTVVRNATANAAFSEAGLLQRATGKTAEQLADQMVSAEVSKSKALRAVGAEEMFDMNACEACGTIEGTLRVRSSQIAFATAGNIGKVEEAERPMLCGECFDAECEDIALSLTGVSLKARNVELRLNERGLTTLPQFASSIENTDTLFWTTTATAWWRDRKGDNHERAWSCFHGGKVVATVTFAHRNRTFVATVRGKVIRAERTLGSAKALANDILMDERNASAVFVEALGGLFEAGEAPATLVRQGG